MDRRGISIRDKSFYRCYGCDRRYPDALLSQERLLTIEEMDKFGVGDEDWVTMRRCARCLREAIYAGDLMQNNRPGTEIRMQPALVSALLVRGYNEGLRESAAIHAEVVAG